MSDLESLIPRSKNLQHNVPPRERTSIFEAAAPLQLVKQNGILRTMSLFLGIMIGAGIFITVHKDECKKY